MMMMMIMIMFMLVFMMIITMMMIVVIVCQRHGSFILLRPPCSQLPVQEEHNAGADEDYPDFILDHLSCKREHVAFEMIWACDRDVWSDAYISSVIAIQRL